jgi:hypothetical protein
LSKQETVAFTVERCWQLSQVLEIAQRRVRDVDVDDLSDLFYEDIKGRLELTDTVDEVLTTESLMLVAAASDDWTGCNTMVCVKQEEPFEQESEEHKDQESDDPIFGIKIVTSRSRARRPSNILLNPGDRVNVLRIEIPSNDGERMLLCETEQGDKAWFPFQMITPQQALQGFSVDISGSDSDASKRKMSIAEGQWVYHCKKANSWIWCHFFICFYGSMHVCVYIFVFVIYILLSLIKHSIEFIYMSIYV